MLCVLLAIYQLDTLVPAKPNQCGKSDLGCIGHKRKHGLTKHRLAQSDAIQAADQVTVYPGFHAVGEAGTVQPAVRLNHGWQYPGAWLAPA